MKERGRGSSSEDLEVYQLAREFRRAMYRVAKQLPDEEKFGLCSQTRRAAVSLTNNIAEGHGRFHFLEQIKFMLQARGSLDELVDDLRSRTTESAFRVHESRSDNELTEDEVNGLFSARLNASSL